MNNWPEDYSGAWTLAGQAERSGVGLHSGRSSVVRLKGSVEPGFYLRVEGHDEAFRLAPHQVRDSQLCTTLELGPCKVATVETNTRTLSLSGKCPCPRIILRPVGH